MDFENIFKEIKNVLIKLLGEKYQGFKSESKKDVEIFLNNSKDKFERWTTLLANKDISIDEYEWLVKSQKDLLTLKALQKAGISKISLGHLKNSIIKSIVGVVKAAVLI